MEFELDRGEFLYFAYGSNMYAPRLNAETRAPSARSIATGHVSGRRLTFDKVSKDNSGKCDCLETGDPHDRVYGVLFAVSESDRSRLDRAEGKGSGYEVEIVSVSTPYGHVDALTYVATHKQEGLKPYDWYLELVLRGGREAGFPEEYLLRIERTVSSRDENTSRAERERAILRS